MHLLTRPSFILAMIASGAIVYSFLPNNKHLENENSLPHMLTKSHLQQHEKRNIISTNKVTVNSPEKHTENKTDIINLYQHFISLYQISDNVIREAQLEIFFQNEIKKNPRELITFIENLKNNKQRKIVYDNVLTLWVEIDLTDFMTWQHFISQNKDSENAFASIALMPKVPLYQALHWLSNIESTALHDSSLKKLIIQQSPTHAEALISWALSNDENKHYLTSIYDAISRYSPLQALLLLSEINTEDIQLQKDVLMKLGLSVPIEKINEPFIMAIEAMENKILRDLMVNVTLPRLIKSGHIEAVDLLLRNVYSANAYPIQQSRLAAKWARSDPLAAANYSGNIDSPKQRSIAITSVVKKWAENDLMAAHDWLQQHSASDNIEQPASKLATVASLSADTLEIALQWLDVIESAQLKSITIQRIVHNWYRYDAQNALDYLANLDSLSATQKRKITNSLKKSSE